MDRITRKDLDQALEHHVAALQCVGIVYDGRLVLSIGSKTYGNAYRLNLTGVMDRCQGRPWSDQTHEGCEECGGTRESRSSAHYRPPVGDDYLGMTAREAYDTLTARTRAVYDTARAINGR